MVPSRVVKVEMVGAVMLIAAPDDQSLRLLGGADPEELGTAVADHDHLGPEQQLAVPVGLLLARVRVGDGLGRPSAEDDQLGQFQWQCHGWFLSVAQTGVSGQWVWPESPAGSAVVRGLLVT